MSSMEQEHVEIIARYYAAGLTVREISERDDVPYKPTRIQMIVAELSRPLVTITTNDTGLHVTADVESKVLAMLLVKALEARNVPVEWTPES